MSTITSIDLGKFKKFQRKKKQIGPEHLKVEQYKNGGPTIQDSLNRKISKKSSHSQGGNKATERDLPSIIEMSGNGTYDLIEPKVPKKNKQELINAQSESSIATMIMKRNIDHINQLSSVVVQSCFKREDVFRRNHSTDKQPYCCKNDGEMNLKAETELSKKSVSKRRQEEDILVHTKNCSDCSKSENKNVISPADQMKKVKLEKRLENNEIMKQKNRPRVVLNTLHVKNRYLVLQCQPDLDQVESGILLKPTDGFRKPKSCPPGQRFSTNEKFSEESVEIIETASEQNRSRLLDKINDLIAPLKSAEAEIEIIKYKRSAMKHSEKRRSLLNCKLVNSIMLHQDNIVTDHSKLAEGSEDVFKSHCDVYYVNTVRNFKRKKYLTMLDKEKRCNLRDDVFNRDNCQTVYMNKARNFEKNLSKLNLLK